MHGKYTTADAKRDCLLPISSDSGPTTCLFPLPSFLAKQYHGFTSAEALDVCVRERTARQSLAQVQRFLAETFSIGGKANCERMTNVDGELHEFYDSTTAGSEEHQLRNPESPAGPRIGMGGWYME